MHNILTQKYINIYSVKNLNPKVAADGRGTFRFKFLFLQLLILHTIFQTF